MRKFSQLNEGKIEVETNSINYLSVGELNKYLDKNESEFYNNVAVDISTKAGSSYTKTFNIMPSGKKRKRHKMATHKRKKRLRKNRHKKK